MSLQPRNPFFRLIMSTIDGLLSRSPSVSQPSPPPAEEPPRKRRRQAGNSIGFVKPENRNAALFQKCDWVIDGPYRRVPPYFYTYYTWAKERWQGVSLFEMFCKEFRDRQPEYYRAAIENGSVCVNGKIVEESYKIRNGDCISHTIHRHEPPVSSRPVKVVHHNPETGLLVIDKPAGIPVHAAGRYHQNSIVTILRLELDFQEVSPGNRLDRLTSGIMLLGLNKDITNQIHLQLSLRSVQKEYYCRVAGKFPEGEISVDMPIASVSPKHGLNRLRPDGKHAFTVFERVFYDEKRHQSVVIAKPLTGRTHQIRVHLQHLGHPIANDPIYANPLIFTSFEDVDGATDEELISRLENIGKSVAVKTLADQKLGALDEKNITSVQGLENPERREMWSGEVCDVCGTNLYLDPAPEELEIWLHAWKYSGKTIPKDKSQEGDEWSYQTEIPEWGREDWQGTVPVFRRRRSSVSPPKE